MLQLWKSNSQFKKLSRFHKFIIMKSTLNGDGHLERWWTLGRLVDVGNGHGCWERQWTVGYEKKSVLSTIINRLFGGSVFYQRSYIKGCSIKRNCILKSCFILRIWFLIGKWLYKKNFKMLYGKNWRRWYR